MRWQDSEVYTAGGWKELIGSSTRVHRQKIFITYGEHDLTENIVHVVLANRHEHWPS